MRIVTAVTVAACTAGAGPLGATDIRVALERLVDAVRPAPVCALGSGPTRTKENVLIWQSEPGQFAAVVIRTEGDSEAQPRWPCWSEPGHCAVFEGPIPAPASACAQGPGIGPAGSGAQFIKTIAGVYRVNGTAAIDPRLISFARAAMKLAAGVKNDEPIVTMFAGAPVYVAEDEMGVRRVRIGAPNGEIRIARLRVGLRELELGRLEVAARMLDTRYLEFAGPRGAIARDTAGHFRAVIDGVCVRLVTVRTMRQRLLAANALLKTGEIPVDDTAARRAFDDMAQRMLGGVVVHGQTIETISEQDPRIFILEETRSRAC